LGVSAGPQVPKNPAPDLIVRESISESIARHEHPRKNRAPRGARFQFAGVGTGNIPEGNKLHTGDSGRKHPAVQRPPNHAGRMPIEQPRAPHDCHAESKSRANSRVIRITAMLNCIQRNFFAVKI
jgi:hypothetical protein